MGRQAVVIVNQNGETGGNAASCIDESLDLFTDLGHARIRTTEDSADRRESDDIKA